MYSVYSSQRNAPSQRWTDKHDEMAYTSRMPERRTEQFVIRLSPAEKKAIEDASWSAHMDMSTWARSILLREAEKQRKK
jgi:hypothetical protein